MYDIYTLLNDLFFEIVRMLFLFCVMGAGIFIGKKLRDRQDSKKTNRVTLDK